MSTHVVNAVRVRVPATSANLGPGLDAFGLALALYNDVIVRTAPSGAEVTVEGEGSERFATGEGNLVVRSVRVALDELGHPVPGLLLHCTNRIPGARGLGSSAASIVAGVVAGALLGRDALEGPAGCSGVDGSGGNGSGGNGSALRGSFPGGLDVDWALELCARLEGHPDNVAACLLGGVTVAWYDVDGRARAARADPAPDLVAVALVPPGRVATADARRLLPQRVTLTDAAHSAGRAALLSMALTSRTDLLLPATEDRLHQTYRRDAMPESLALMWRLRDCGLAATISGAGPSVLVLASAVEDGSALGSGPTPQPGRPYDRHVDLMAAIAAADLAGFAAVPLHPDPRGVQVRPVDPQLTR